MQYSDHGASPTTEWHDRGSFHRDIEASCCHPSHLPMSVSTPLCQCPMHLGLITSVQPLFPEHRGGEQRKPRQRGQYISHIEHRCSCCRRASNQGRETDVFSEGGGVGILNKHAKEFCRRFAETLLDISPNVDDEAGVTADDNPD